MSTAFTAPGTISASGANVAIFGVIAAISAA
jgi:hypothetical protein